MNSQLLGLMVLIPFLGCLVMGLIGRAWKPGLAGLVGSAFSLASALIAFSLGLKVLKPDAPALELGPWTYLGAGQGLSVGLRLDALSGAMACLVGLVAFLVHVYSSSYLSTEPRLGRYYSYLNLFQGMMMLLITGSDLLTLFAGWEGVGLCSYLLIGYWFEKPAPPAAGKKAFVVNRVGDAGFLFAMAALFAGWGSLSITALNEKAASDPGPAVFAGFFLLLGVAGKSAQVPLAVWLPDAMEGPTPVSALIHAATMVTAGVYLMLRLPAFFSLEPLSTVVTILGLATALWGAFSALGQDDIKKVMAYSTVSQLGLMAAALGAGEPGGAFNHLLTHGFFKALLFLAAGSVIHGLSGTQSLAAMGGLFKAIPLTGGLTLIGVLAISGVPPFSGFFTKEEMLSGLAHKGAAYLFLGLLVSFLTATYMSRMFALAFLGKARGHHHPHESGPLMTLPMGLLALLSAGGFLMVREGGLLHVSLKAAAEVAEQSSSHAALVAASLAAAALGLSLGLLSGTKPGLIRLPEFLPEAARRNFGLDELMAFLGRLLGPGLAKISAGIEILVLARIPDALARAWTEISSRVRGLSNGRVQAYAWYLAAAVFALILVLGRELP